MIINFQLVTLQFHDQIKHQTMPALLVFDQMC